MRIVSPHQSLLFAPVTGTVDATYQASWLTDGRPNYPVKRTGDLSLTVTPAAAQDVDVVAVCQHNLRAAATITLGGSLSSTIATAALPPNGIQKNWFRHLATPVSVSSLVLGITGNTDPEIIGLLYAGLSFELTSDLGAGRSFDPGRPFAWEGEYATVAPDDPGLATPRRLSGQLLLTDAEYASLLACIDAMRNGTRPALVILDDAVNDALLCTFQITEVLTGGNHLVTIEIVEIPRVRW